MNDKSGREFVMAGPEAEPTRTSYTSPYVYRLTLMRILTRFPYSKENGLIFMQS